MFRYVVHCVTGNVRLIIKRRIHTKIVDNTRKKKRTSQDSQEWQLLRSNQTGPLWRVGHQARRLFVEHSNAALAKASPAIDDNIRRIFYNNRIPFFAFVGVSLASGSMAIITKEDELEGMCWEIRHTIAKMQESRHDLLQVPSARSLEELEIGPFIGKGCSAVVYAASWRTPTPEMKTRLRDIDDYPLALKMMFNYDIQSNAMLIHRAMRRETLPARGTCMDSLGLPHQPHMDEMRLPPHPNIVTMFNAFCDQIPDIEDAAQLYPSALPSRLNVDGYGRNMSLFLLMKRYNCTLERFLQRPGKKSAASRLELLLFAQLLEAVAHLYRHGIAHRDLKSDNILLETLSDRSVPLLVLNDFGCCLADRLNGLVVPYPTEDMDRGGNAALMAPEIITKRPGRSSFLDYTRADLWAAGTIAYEIFGQRNPFIAAKGEGAALLRNVDYLERDLPQLGEKCPLLVQRLIENLLKRNPRKRLFPDVAANVMQLFLWAPSTWLNPTERLPTSDEVIDWLFCMTTKVLCENIFKGSDKNPTKDSYTEYLLISSFLQRASLSRIKQALLWIRTVNRQ